MVLEFIDHKYKITGDVSGTYSHRVLLLWKKLLFRDDYIIYSFSDQAGHILWKKQLWNYIWIIIMVLYYTN